MPKQTNLYIFEPGATAGNVVAEYTVPYGKPLRLLYGTVSLTTNATVANRRLKFSVLDGATVTASVVAGATVAASQTGQVHNYMQGTFRETSFIGGEIQVPIPPDMYVSPGRIVRIEVIAGVAGDSFTPRFVLGD